MIYKTTIAMIFLLAIATVGAIGITIEMGIQSVQGQAFFDPDDSGKSKSFHDRNGDEHSNRHA